MPAGLAITMYLAAGLMAGALGGTIAPRKRRHVGFWTIAAFLFPPLLLVLLVLPRAPYVRQEWVVREADPDNLDLLD
jgi:hypothetical protein